MFERLIHAADDAVERPHLRNVGFSVDVALVIRAVQDKAVQGVDPVSASQGGDVRVHNLVDGGSRLRSGDSHARAEERGEEEIHLGFL